MPVTSKVKGKEVTLSDSERTRCENWTRVMGYYRPVQAFNIGKVQEHKDRKNFILPDIK